MLQADRALAQIEFPVPPVPRSGLPLPCFLHERNGIGQKDGYRSLK
jgi:hypothetical protein